MTGFFTRLSHLLIPRAGNGYHPHILRRYGLAVVALMVTFMPTAYNLSTTGDMQVLGYATDISVSGLHSATNQQRTANGVAAYTLNSLLSQAAQNKAADMFADDYWAHTAPDGTTPWSFISAAGYSYSAVGENLAKNFMTSSGVVNGWMNSPSHQANLLSSTYSEVGYGVMNGTLQCEEVTLVVAMYGAPYVAPAPTTSTKTESTKSETTPSASTQETTPSTSTPVSQEPEEPAEEPSTATEEAEPEVVEATKDEVVEAVTSTEGDTEVTGEVAGVTITAPLEAYVGLNWAQKSTIFMMTILALLFVMSHTLLWRAKKRGVPHVWFRAHPLVQAGTLGVAIVFVLASGTGVIL